MTESAYSISERASTTLGLTLSHLVDFSGHQGNKIVPQHLVPSSLLNRNQRFPSVRGCFNGGHASVRLKAAITRPDLVRPMMVLDRLVATFKAPSGRCFPQFDRKTDCFDGGLEKGSPRDFVSSLTLMATNFRITSKAVCGTQTRMPKGFNLMCNQTQALTTPVNLVGGSLMTEPYLPLVGSSHPTKGEAMNKITGE